MQQGKTHIYGRHAVMEALLHAPYCLETVFLMPSIEDTELLNVIKEKGISIETLKEESITQKVGRNAKHQGIVALMDPSKLLIDFETFNVKFEINSNTLLIALDGLEDPHNVGAIIRSAAAFGAAGILLPTTGQSPITGAVVKASVGMTFRLPLISVPDMPHALETLKAKDCTVYGLAMDGRVDIHTEPFDKPSVIVVGNESRGLSPETTALCDTLLCIPIHPRCKSLNAAASTTIALYQWSTKHREILSVILAKAGIQLPLM